MSGYHKKVATGGSSTQGTPKASLSQTVKELTRLYNELMDARLRATFDEGTYKRAKEGHDSASKSYAAAKTAYDAAVKEYARELQESEQCYNEWQIEYRDIQVYLTASKEDKRLGTERGRFVRRGAGLEPVKSGELKCVQVSLEEAVTNRNDAYADLQKLQTLSPAVPQKQYLQKCHTSLEQWQKHMSSTEAAWHTSQKHAHDLETVYTQKRNEYQISLHAQR